MLCWRAWFETSQRFGEKKKGVHSEEKVLTDEISVCEIESCGDCRTQKKEEEL